jgi:polysaccharide chain length determinant protein (PEP-CTERM system associated)
VIPGKKYKPEDFIEAAWRRRWFILIPLVVIALGTMIVVERLPDRYESSATLLIVPQRIPESYVKNPVSVRIDERLMSIGQEILSRTRLESIVQEFNLYPEERRTKIMEDVIETMRTRDITFNTRNARADSGSFTISFQYSDPRIAQQVAQRLASLFIQENTQDRAVLAELTDEFLNSQLKDAERQLKERENQLAQFRRDHPGTMPTQVDSNQQGLQNAQLQLQGVQESISRDRDRQITIQRQIADIQMQASLAPPPDANGQAQPQSYARQLEQARAALKNMRLKLTPDHPDIKALNRTIKDLEQKAAVEASEGPVSGTLAGASPAEVARAKQLADLQTELVTIQHRLADRQQEEKQLLASMSTFRARLEAAPTVASELTDLMRDYETLKAQYQGLLAKSQDAKVAANLERRQIGEQFKLIDSARLPQRPKSPDRFRLNIMGALAGLMIGLGLAGVLEYRDTSLRTEDDVLVALSLPVLATVPTMSTDAERQRRKRHKLLLASSGAVALVLCLAAIAWKLRLNEWMW